MKNIEMRNRKILVRRLEYSNTTEGGIYLPEVARDEAAVGVVKKIGPAVEEISVKDKITFVNWAGTEIDYENETHLIMDEEDVSLIL